MYDIEIIKDDKYVDCYVFKTKNVDNQTLELMIFNTVFSDFSTSKTYCVTFRIVNKRKVAYQYLRQTGTDGIKSLVWAKKCIEYFIDNTMTNGDKITIYGDDGRRLNIYYYGLKNLSFDRTKINGCSALIFKKK